MRSTVFSSGSWSFSALGSLVGGPVGPLGYVVVLFSRVWCSGLIASWRCTLISWSGCRCGQQLRAPTHTCWSFAFSANPRLVVCCPQLGLLLHRCGLLVPCACFPCWLAGAPLSFGRSFEACRVLSAKHQVLVAWVVFASPLLFRRV